MVKIEFTGFSQEEWGWNQVRRVLEHRGFAQYWQVVLQIDGVRRNDQILKSERGPGCFALLARNGKIGLIQHAFRPQVRDRDLHERTWPHETANELCANLGRRSWEFPRGYAKDKEGGVHTAIREAAEETGYAVAAHLLIGYTCGNTAVDVHDMTVVVGLVDQKRSDLPADPNEKLRRKLTFFTPSEIADLVRKGELYCGITLAALQLIEANGGVKEVLRRLQEQ